MPSNTNRVGHDQPETTIVSILVPPATIESPELHDVRLPPEKTTFQKLRRKLSELFFPDDPLHGFKNRTRVKKILFALHFMFPIFQWAPNYDLTLFRSDGISYAKLANLPPVIGLYSSFVPPLIYAVLGSSKHLAVGPVSIASLVMGTMLNDAVSYSLQPVLYLNLAFTATFFAGLFQASLGLLRLGFVIDFLSKATLVGFMAGAAVIVSLQQLKGLLGIVNFTSKMQIIPVLSSVIEQRDQGMRRPNLFLVSAIAPLVSVILSTVLVAIFRTKLPDVATEGIAVGRTFAALKNYQVDGNKEMIAIGLMNMAGSCSSCYVTSDI
ncbi:hypothetical protein L1987_01609 [Smallanthus sonchifolius]|uniref:Uncharacterized protein n=1 Tax=Smallanthus sonchifolius TaxID=185202 RepID=A0ACB9K5K2_9ASTR|nr:hypothetical protein L1987_01609 [Smallanthus sonchifolius]